ncbi:p-loop containing nucleoside triphosphate hydrolase [Venustampulla echinocandica]|uniref:Peroxisomal ATPase PEX1 n=1 Tax=Venustampulla echinocandica TaxID=2656787 RepID=A0A370TU20_9HELO|nr:p-loop containing nucleoside triphosphate hydrolase [Venustampulla echinocandica]RDL39027.1 p-loop containing nucleoside triphosphate hydrolase [Venustampulla echinocandica]
MVSRGGRPTLIQALDKEIYQVVRKLADDQHQLENGSSKRLTVSVVYDHIKHSNSSLKRRSKKLLEDSIERVLLVLKEQELDDSESLDGDFDGIEEEHVPKLKDHNIMNKSITRMWSKPNPATLTPREGTPPVAENNTVAMQITQTRETDSTVKVDRQANGEPRLKRRKGERAQKEVDRTPPTDISLENLGGVENVIEELNELVAMPMLYPDTYIRTGIQPPRGVLLHGPPGCGKTMIANAFAAEIGVSFIPLSAPSLVAGMSGESEKKIRDIFEEAKSMAPCLVFIDEIDVIMGKRESAQREMEKRIVAQMLTCMDEMALEKTGGKPVIIIAATNRPDSLDPALRRAGRFNKEINLGVPNEQAREKILRALTQKLSLDDDFDYRALAKMTPGFVGADLNDVVSVAGTEAMKRMMAVLKQRTATDMELDDPPATTTPPALLILRSLVAHAGESSPDGDFNIKYTDFLAAVPKVQPSAKREGFATIPDTTWSHIGALHSVREQLEMAIVEPIKRPESFARVGITAPTGVLLWGPPGCGKTLLAKAVANESKANFISIKGPELLNKYVGESERAVRQVFERARSSVPCILFFDELDALVPKREDSLSEASSKVVNTLLTELDGLSNRAGIYVVAATNRPDMIDPAMLRPGRLGTSVFVDLPTADERVEILKALFKKALPAAGADEVEALDGVARDERCNGYSGADLGNLHQAAAVAALKREMVGGVQTEQEELRILGCDWEAALGKVKASVKDAGKYRRLKERGIAYDPHPLETANAVPYCDHGLALDIARVQLAQIRFSTQEELTLSLH